MSLQQHMQGLPNSQQKGLYLPRRAQSNKRKNKSTICNVCVPQLSMQPTGDLTNLCWYDACFAMSNHLHLHMQVRFVYICTTQTPHDTRCLLEPLRLPQPLTSVWNYYSIIYCSNCTVIYCTYCTYIIQYVHTATR